MGLSISLILALLSVIIFIGWMFITRNDKNRIFIQYILITYPFLASYIVPGAFAMNGFNLLVYIFAICFYKRKTTTLKNKGIEYTVPFLGLCLIIIVGLWNAESLGEDVIRDLIDFLPIFIFSKILVQECLADARFFYQILKCIKITLVVSLFFLCGQFVFGVQFGLNATINPNMGGDIARYPSFFSDPQVYSQYLAVVSFLCLIKDPEDDRLPMYNYALLILALIGIMYTGGRGGFGGWAFGLFFLIIFGNAKYRMSALVTCGLLFLLIYNFGENFALFQRGDNLTDSYEDRYGIWLDAFNIFLNHPFVGIGYGNYANYVSVHNPDQFWMVGNEIVYYDHPESGYLKLLTELGALGFLAIIMLIITPLGKAFVLYLKKRNISLILMIASVLSWMVAFYTVYSLGDIRMKCMIAVVLCLLITSEHRIQEEEEQEEYAEESI